MNIGMASKEAAISWINDYRYQFSYSELSKGAGVGMYPQYFICF